MMGFFYLRAPFSRKNGANEKEKSNSQKNIAADLQINLSNCSTDKKNRTPMTRSWLINTDKKSKKSVSTRLN